jgi:hypothetical protein
VSRGPGRIERAIRQLFDAHPDEAFVTDELAEHCYPDVRPVTRKHQVAVLRAAWNVLKNEADWCEERINGMGNGYVFYNAANVRSTTLGRSIVWGDIVYRSPGRACRPPTRWTNHHHFRRRPMFCRSRSR